MFGKEFSARSLKPRFVSTSASRVEFRPAIQKELVKIYVSDKKTYPLSFLFVIVTICAVIIAMCVTFLPAFHDISVGKSVFAKALAWGGLGGGILGMIMGCYRIHRGYGVLVCGLIGVFVGSITSCLVLVDADSFPKLVTSQVGGSVLILFLAALLRFGVRKEID